MNKTLTQEELQQVQDIRKQALELASALGELGYQQVLIDLDKANLTQAVINLETGEIQPRS